MKKLFLLFYLSIGLFGCERSEPGKEKAMNLTLKAPQVAMQKSISANKPAAPEQTTPDVTRKIIKEGDISFETSNPKETRKAIYNALQKLGGYIDEENEGGDSSNTGKEYILKARVPENNFDHFVDNVSLNATRINNKHISVKDVTTEYIDIITQIKNKKVLENTYLGLLKQTNKMSDVLQIENKLTEIRTTIDSTQSELNYLNKQVAYSSLTITFYSKQTIKDDGQTLGAKFIDAVSGGWNGLGVIFFACLTLWPLWTMAIVTYFIFNAWRKRRNQKKIEQS